MSDHQSSGKHSAVSALKGMFSFFTMIPINIDRRNMDDMNAMFWLTPVVGAFFGLLAGTVFCLLSEYTTALVAAAATLFVIGFTNRFLHLDGMIDVGDGLTVAGKREDHIRALKDTLIGAGGMATGLFVILMTFAEYASMTIPMFMFIGFAAEVVSRNAQVSAAAFGTAGNGMAGDSVRGTSPRSLVYSTILSAAIIALYCFLLNLNWAIASDFTIPLIVGFIAAPLWGYIMSRVAEKNFGMVNGDVLGATNESARVITVLVMMILFYVL